MGFFSRHSLHTLSSLSTWSFFVRSLAVTTLFLSLTLTISQIPSLLSGLDVPLPHPFHHHTPDHRDNSSSLTLLDIPSVTSPSRDSTTVEPDLQSFRPQSNDQSFSSSLTNPFTMAGLKNIILAASLLAPLTMAAPRLDVRAMYTHTDTEIVWVTVEETTTVWLDAASATPGLRLLHQLPHRLLLLLLRLQPLHPPSTSKPRTSPLPTAQAARDKVPPVRVTLPIGMVASARAAGPSTRAATWRLPCLTHSWVPSRMETRTVDAP